MMTLYSADNSKLMEVSALEIEGNQLLIKGKIFGAMPMTAKLRPEEVRKLFGLLNLKLIFFLLTWNAARTENELDVKVPKASAAREKTAPIGDVIVNVKADGNVVVNRRTLSGPELEDLLKNLVQLNPEQAVVIRGDEAGAYRNIIGVLNVCTEAGITNVAFATAR